MHPVRDVIRHVIYGIVPYYVMVSRCVIVLVKNLGNVRYSENVVVYVP